MTRRRHRLSPPQNDVEPMQLMTQEQIAMSQFLKKYYHQHRAMFRAKASRDAPEESKSSNKMCVITMDDFSRLRVDFSTKTGCLSSA